MAICEKGFDIQNHKYCGEDCSQCKSFNKFNKKQRAKEKAINNWEDFLRLLEKKEKPKCVECYGYVKEDSDWQGTSPAYCTFKDCPFESEEKRKQVIAEYKKAISKAKNELGIDDCINCGNINCPLDCIGKELRKDREAFFENN